MKKRLALALTALSLLAAPVFAAEGQKDAKQVYFSFDSAFGTFDRTQLQRGYKVYKEVCSSCHAMKLIAFRNLSEAGIFSEDEVKALAATFTVKDGPNDKGEMFERPGLPSDRFPSTYENDEAAKAGNDGALPPDLSLLAKSRPGWYGTWNQFWNGIGGPQYIYSVLMGYEEPSEKLKKEQPEGKYYNPYFGSGHWIGMPQPVADGIVTFDDGAPNDADAVSRDVAAFLAWTADPNMEARKRTGLMVLIFLAVLSGLLYVSKKKVWADIH